MSQTPRQSHSHITPAINYHLTLIALVVLMLLTVWIARFQLPPVLFLSGVAVNNIVAMTIAIIKATCVVMIFMGVKYQTPLVKLWALIGFVGLILMLGIMLDYFSRGPEVKHGWEPYNDGAMPRARPTDDEMKAPMDPRTDNTQVRQPKP